MEKFNELYKDLVNEGFIRRLGNKFHGLASRKSNRSTNRNHALANSIALDAAKDIRKLFKGDETAHYKAIYPTILKYLSQINP